MHMSHVHALPTAFDLNKVQKVQTNFAASIVVCACFPQAPLVFPFKNYHVKKETLLALELELSPDYTSHECGICDRDYMLHRGCQCCRDFDYRLEV
jgi:hypothetical protein